MKIINKIVWISFFVTLLLSGLNAATKEVTVTQGWNQIRVPFDNVNVDFLTSDENIDVIWANQYGTYKLGSNNASYLEAAQARSDIGVLSNLSFGESIYLFAKEDSTITFVGTENTSPPARSDKLTSVWVQMSKKDFKESEWNFISKIVEGQQVIASKIVMKDGRPSLKVFSNVAEEVAKINPKYFEDFEVGEDEAFWVRDASNISDINKFDFLMTKVPSKGGETVDFRVDAASNDKNRNYLAVKIVAFKDGDIRNKKHVLFDDYVKLNFGVQSIESVMPMLLEEDFGNYKIYVIKDLAARYDKYGIDFYNLNNESPDDVKKAYQQILDSSIVQDVTLSANSSEVVYRLKIESREYANNVLYYDPLKELNRLAKNQSRGLEEYSYKDISKHTSFQLNVQAYGHGGKLVEKTKIKAYINVNGTPKEVIILSDRSRLEEAYTLDNLQISLPNEIHGGDLSLAMMLYGVDALTDNKDLSLYNEIMSDLNKTKQICLDDECSEWIYKKEYEIDIAVSDSEPTPANIIGKTTVTLYSDTFSNVALDSYESKDTIVSLTNLLLKEDIYDDVINQRRVGILGSSGDTNQLIVDLQQLKTDVKEQVDENLIFNPLGTYETDKIDLMIYGKDAEGNVDKTQIIDATLQKFWEAYIGVGDVANHLCNRKNYFSKTVPYSKTVKIPVIGDDLKVITATDDLCLYNVDYAYLNALSPSEIETLAENFKQFILVKNSKSEDERLADFWNPLFSFNNATLHMPEYYAKEMPVVQQRMGGGVAFSSKLALDSELNELRTNAYVDVDVELVKEFKLLDLDFETVVSGSNTDASRFDFYLYSIDPTKTEDDFAMKKVFTYNQQIQTTYENSRLIDLTFEKGKSIHFQAGPVPLFFQFSIGVYAFFQVGIILDITDHFSIYAIPGARIFGTLAGGLGIDLAVLKVDIGVLLEDFTVIRASVPVVASLDEFKLDKSGFSTVFKIYANLVMRVAEITASIFVDISTAGEEIINITIDLFNYHGFDPIKALGLKSDDGSGKYPTDCQDAYDGVELFCVRKELKLEFTFSGLTTAECSLLDTEYKRRREFDGDETYLLSTNEYRKVRGCVNDSYTFENVSLDDWQLTEEQVAEVSNADFWKDDSRAIINQAVEAEEIIDPFVTPWADVWQTSDDGNSDEVHDRWKELTGNKW